MAASQTRTPTASRMYRPRSWLVALTLFSALVACARSRTETPVFVMGQEGAIARARADSVRYPYTKADIDFMSGMIHHHAQALVMARMVPTHNASPSIQRLAERIINAQADEITLMRQWLTNRLQPAAQVDSLGNVTMPGGGDHAAHHGHGASMIMPGMLTAAQLEELDTARGSDFDRLFLTYMIQHHRGAISMVHALFASPGAGQDETVFKFANEVEVDQTTEIKRMLSMILEMGFPPPPATPSTH